MEGKQLDLFRGQNGRHARNVESAEQKIHLLALSRIPGIGFQTLRKMLERYGRFDSVWVSSENEVPPFASRLAPDQARKIAKTMKERRDTLLQKAQNDLQNYNKRGIDIVFIFESGFPKRLSEIPDPPYWLIVR